MNFPSRNRIIEHEIDEEETIFPWPEIKSTTDGYLTYNETLRKSKPSIIIDNGSFQCRAGWSTRDNPFLVFRNQIARLRGKKGNETQVGNDIQNIETIRWLVKTQFDKNIVTQFDVQEIIFDYIFSHLGINTEGRVEHPVIITEALCNPNYSRQMMSELLFECYQVPHVAYGVDSLFSYYYNQENAKTGLIVSLGHNTTHVIPFVNDHLDIEHSKRINVGGYHLTNFFQRFLQVTYPFHASSITLSHVESLIYTHMHFSENYSEDLDKWENKKFYDENVYKIQLPFTPLPESALDTEEGRFEKCIEILRHVQTMKMKRRTEKLAYGEERLQELLSVQELIDDEDDEAILALQDLGYSTASELLAGIKEMNCKIEKLKNTIYCQQGEDANDSPLKGWSDDLDLNIFPDVESWIEAVRQRKIELTENPVRARSGVLSNELAGFSFSRALDVIGGLHEICGTDRSYMDYVSETVEHKEHMEILNEIISEYDREFEKSKPSVIRNLVKFYQLLLGVERIRIPEILYQPTILGIEQAGIAESIEMVLKQYNSSQQQQLAENIFVTGSCSKFASTKARIEAEVMAMRPFQSKFNVYLAGDSSLDSWRGARKWAITSNNLSKYGISKLEYEEKGGEYFKEHSFSNKYYPTPASIRKTPDILSSKLVSKTC